MSNIAGNKTYVLFVFIFLISFCIYSSASDAQNSVTYIPISVGDIFVIFPVFNEDADNNGVPDYEDPGIQPIQMVDAFFSALKVNDIDMAMKFLLTKKSARYRSTFESLGSDAGAVASQLTNFTVTFSSPRLVELAANRAVDGVPRVFFITLMKNDNDVWKVTEI